MLRLQIVLTCMQEASERTMASETHIREVNSTDISLLSGLIRDSFRDVARRFGLNKKNCPKHPSHCTDEWIEKDISRGITFYVVENDRVAVGCVGFE